MFKGFKRLLYYLPVVCPPRLDAFVCLNIYVSEKPYLYLHWELVNGYKVKVGGLRKFVGKKGTVAFRIPASLETLEFTYANLWFKRKEIVPLKRLTVSQDILLKMVDRQFVQIDRTKLNDSKLLLPKPVLKTMPNTVFKLSKSHIQLKPHLIALKRSHYE